MSVGHCATGSSRTSNSVVCCWPLKACLWFVLTTVQITLLISSAFASEKCEVLRVNGADNWYPVLMRPEGSDQTSGVLVEVIEKIAGDLGIPVKYGPAVPFKRQLLELERGDLDAVLGAYWTEDRSKRYNYSGSVFEDEVAIFVRKGKEFPLSSWADLKEREGIRPYGGSYGEKFDRYAEENLTIRFLETGPGDLNLLNMVARNRADFAVLGRYHGLKMRGEEGWQEDVVDLEWPLVSNSVHILFSKASPCARQFEAFNGKLNDLKASGWVDEVLSHYQRPDKPHVQ